MIDEVVRDQDVFIIQPCSAPVNDNLMELLLYIDAFRRASAHEITAVIPYYPYGRQERMARGREAISAKVVATMLEAMGVGRVVYFDVHAPATQGFFDVPVDPLTALPVLAEYFRTPEFRDAAIVSPDVGRAKFAGRYAEILGLPLVVMHKRRESFEQGRRHPRGRRHRGQNPHHHRRCDRRRQRAGRGGKAGQRRRRPRSIWRSRTACSCLRPWSGWTDRKIKQLVISDTICQPEAICNHPKIKVVSVARCWRR